MNINLEDLPLKMRKQAEVKIKAQRMPKSRIRSKSRIKTILAKHRS